MRYRSVPSQPYLLAAALVALLLAAGCADRPGESEPALIPGAATPVDDPFSGGYPTYDDPATGLRIVFGTPDIAAGVSRISFALFDYDGLISTPRLVAVSRYYPGGPSTPPEATSESSTTIPLTFRPFPDGGRGIYTGHGTFARPGLWSLSIALDLPDGPAEVTFPIEVAEATVAPDVGTPAPQSVHRTAADEPDLHRLTTDSHPDPRLYERTVASAIDTGRPFVLTFASPAFCTNALCGPQVEVLSELADTYAEAADFIHIDLYENPDEIRGDLSIARRTPALAEWGIHTDEWTFVVDAAGMIRARFEGFAPREEVEEALLAVIATGP